MKWRDLSRPAKAYILYHMWVAPQLFVWYLFPEYLLRSGYSILAVGTLYTLAEIFALPATYLVGRVFNRLPLRTGLILVDAVEGVAYGLYAFATGIRAKIFLVTGRVVETLASTLYPLYGAFEQHVYPREAYERALAWHMALPQLSMMLSYPVLGFCFGRLWTSPEHTRMAFLAFALLSLPSMVYIRLTFPSLDVRSRLEQPAWRWTFRDFGFFLAVDGLLWTALNLMPGMILLYYVKEVLHGGLFELSLLVSFAGGISLLASAASLRIPTRRGFHVIAGTVGAYAGFAFFMALTPSWGWVVLAYLVRAFADTLAFPFYRAWLFRVVPPERSPEFMATRATLQRLIGWGTPVLAGALAQRSPALPYGTSVMLLGLTGVLLWLGKRKRLFRDQSAPSIS